MISPISADCARTTYVVKTNELKTNNKPLNKEDFLNVGYMAGRFGINLSSNPNERNRVRYTPNGTFVNINSCTSELFEEVLQEKGIKFDKLA